MDRVHQCIQILRVSVFLYEAVLKTPALAVSSNLGGMLSLPNGRKFSG
jgi:hypothetical protein